MPIRIAADAFGPDCPSRDLLVSPGHSICVDVLGEVLIPASVLVNGTTVTQDNVERITYWHVELDGHDVILAENMPAESYLEMGNRLFFTEDGVVSLAASPDAHLASHADFCRPFHAVGPFVEVVRAQLSARARTLGWRLEERGPCDIHLLIDGVCVDPRVRGFVARFRVPKDAQNVWLVSPTSIPAEVADTLDMRSLGACLTGFEVRDGFGASRAFAIDDPRLCVGFHDVESDGVTRWRWTAGRARLPASMWSGATSDVFLHVNLAGATLPRWIAPSDTEVGDTWIKLAS